jgi:glutamate-5-semialdehyde dehydrogenase
MAAIADADIATRGRAAARALATLGRDRKDAALHAAAAALGDARAEILEANAEDVAAAREAGTATALLDRLTLDDARLAVLRSSTIAIAALPDPCGEVVEGRRLDNGLDVARVRVPLGRVLVVYEGRPNVTVDVAGLCLKSGNVALLRGSRLSRRTDAALLRAVHAGFAAADVPEDAAIPLELGRDELARLVAAGDAADVVVPRGGEGLKHFLLEHSRIPVLAAAGGNCHVYVDATADAAMAEAIVVNAKVQRPGVCNAAETLLVHADAAPQLPTLLGALAARGVELRGCERTRAAAPDVAGAPATDDDYATEFLDLVLAVRVVDSLDEAVEHVARFSTGHSEAIVTDSVAAAERFVREVDSACVYVNASTRFTDGGEFGMGAEIGNSTSRLHARGPIGLRDLTTTKYVVRGDGQIRG